MAARRALLGVFTACCVASQLALALGTADESASAIVSELRGSATVEESGKPRRAVQVYDWLGEGATIAVARRSTVVIVLASGARFELGEGARATVLREGLPTSAAVRSLPPLPPLPTVPPIATATGTAARQNPASTGESAAVRIRGPSIRNLYPSGDTTIAESTTLRFDGPSAAKTYLVSITDERDAPVYDVKTEASVVVVPLGVLEAGRQYSWRVKVADDSVASAHAEAAFITLLASAVKARVAFIASLRRDDTPDMALLAQIDQRLGLLMEARDELMAAVARVPTAGHLRRMLGDINKRIESSK